MELNPHIHIDDFVPGNDIEKYREIMLKTLKDEITGEPIISEIEEILRYMRGGKDDDGRLRRYIVAKDDNGTMLGLIGYTEPSDVIIKHLNIKNPEEYTEAVNVFSDPDAKTRGAGRSLIQAVFDTARKNGKKYVVGDSGPRYKKNWSRYHDKIFDKRVGIIPAKYGFDKFGKPYDATVWIKKL